MIERLSVPGVTTISPEVTGIANRYTSGWGTQGPATWVGTTEALGALGREPRTRATQEGLEKGLRALHATRLEQVRLPTMSETRDAKGRRIGELSHLEVRFVAPPAIADLWSRSDREQRSRIEAAMLDGMDAALGSLTMTNPATVRPLDLGMSERGPATGFAAAAVVKGTPGAHGTSPLLEVRGVVVGVVDVTGRLTAPDIPESTRRDWEREADFAAYEAVAQRLEGLAPSRAADDRLEDPAAIGREDVWVASPVEAHRPVLGDELVERFERPVDDLRKQLEPYPSESLLDRRAELERPFDQLDTDAAIEVLRAERNREALDKLDGDERFFALVADLSDGQGDLGDAAQATRNVAEIRRERATEYSARERELIEEGRHPRQWMVEHGRAAVTEAAIDWELAIRSEVEIANAVERSIADPPSHVLDALGPAPDRATPAGVRWEGLAREVAWTHATAEANGPETSRANPGETERRVDAWRADQGLTPRDGPGAVPDIGM
jgi:hypothetical protein